jgi:hypothetical protein
MLVLVVVIFSLFLYEFGSNFPEKIYIYWIIPMFNSKKFQWLAWKYTCVNIDLWILSPPPFLIRRIFQLCCLKQTFVTATISLSMPVSTICRTYVKQWRMLVNIFRIMYEKMKMSSFLDLTFDPDIENLHHTRMRRHA